MTEIRGIIFGAAYESWIKLSQKWESNNDILTHLFDIHDEFCKQCVESRTSACSDRFSDIVRGTVEENEQSESSSSNESKRTAKRRTIKAKRKSQSSQILSNDSNSNTDQSDIVMLIKHEVMDPEFDESSNTDTHEPTEDREEPRDTYANEDSDKSHPRDAAYLDDTLRYKETLVDEIDVYVKRESTDTEHTDKSKTEKSERLDDTSTQDHSTQTTMHIDTHMEQRTECEHPTTKSEFVYTDDISVEKRQKLRVRKSRGFYQIYTPEEKAKIAKYAVENGIANAVRHFSRLFNKQLHESTVREFKKKYLSQSRGSNFTDLTKIESKPRGRPRMPVPPPPPPPSPPPPPPPRPPPGERRKRGEYQKYTPEIKAAIAKYAIDLGCAKAAKHFSKSMNRHINESTVRSFRRSYLQQAKGGDLQTLECRKRGRRKPKPYSAQVIDHLIEFGSLPSKDSCEFLIESSVEEDVSKTEEETMNVMREMIKETQGSATCDDDDDDDDDDDLFKDKSYPVIETVEDCGESKATCIKESIKMDCDHVNLNCEELSENSKNFDALSKQMENEHFSAMKTESYSISSERSSDLETTMCH